MGKREKAANGRLDCDAIVAFAIRAGQQWENHQGIPHKETEA
jgi:hypothetical protein